MTYNPEKPDLGPSPAIDAVLIRTNFSQYASIFSRTLLGVIYNHTPLNDRNQGDHEAIIIELQTQDPGVTQNLVNLYSKNATSQASTEPQLWMQLKQYLPTANDTTQNLNLGMQLTYNSVGLAPPIYYSFLAGEQLYLVYFGTDSGVINPNTPIVDTITLVPTPTELVMAIANANTFTTGGVPFSASTKITATDTFTINSLANTDVPPATPPLAYSFTWIAIAKA